MGRSRWSMMGARTRVAGNGPCRPDRICADGSAAPMSLTAVLAAACRVREAARHWVPGCRFMTTPATLATARPVQADHRTTTRVWQRG